MVVGPRPKQKGEMKLMGSIEKQEQMRMMKKQEKMATQEKKKERKEKKEKEKKGKENENEMSGPAFLNYKGRDNKIYEITNLPLY